MNDKQAKDQAMSTSSPSTQPKTFIAKEYVVPGALNSSNGNHEPRSPAIKESDPAIIRKESTPNSTKVSSSNKSFLHILKDFNIDRSRYNHYGYQSSMTSQQLEKIEDDVDAKGKDDSNDSSSNKEEDSSPKHSRRSSKSQESGSPSSNRLIIDEKISEILGLPQCVVEDEEIWPYNVDTLNEILKYKVEQEKTRQETLKNEFSCSAIELLKLAKSMNINGDLIPLLFVSSSFTIDDLREKVHKLRNAPEEVLSEILHDSRDEAAGSQAKISPKITSSGKRKFSDTQLPSFSETAQSLKPQNVESPLRSPNKSPNLSHRRVVSDSSETTNRGSSTTSPPTYAQLPLPPSAQPHHSRQHSPSIQPQHVVYPVYYSPGPPGQNGGPPTGPGYAGPSHHQMGMQPGQAPEQNPNNALGSPYSQKYNQVVYEGSNGPISTPQMQYQNAPGYVGQQPHYPYYVSTSPNNPPVTSSQYIVQAPPHQQVVHSSKHQHVPSHQFQTSPDSNQKSNITLHDDHIPHKKQKPSAKTNNINFMITTPKNPPARKYNNPNKDK